MFLYSLLRLGLIVLVFCQTITPQAIKDQTKDSSAHSYNVLHLQKRAQYDKMFKSNVPMITLYSGQHCGPCKLMKPFYYRVAEQRNYLVDTKNAHQKSLLHNANFCLIDTSSSELYPILGELGIDSIPTLVFSCNGKIYDQQTGGLSQGGITLKVKEFLDKLTPVQKPHAKVKRTKKATKPILSNIITKKNINRKKKQPVKKSIQQKPKLNIPFVDVPLVPKPLIKPKAA